MPRLWRNNANSPVAKKLLTRHQPQKSKGFSKFMAVCLYDFPLNYSLSLSLPQELKIDPQEGSGLSEGFSTLDYHGF